MPDTKPRENETTAPSTGIGTPPSAPTQEKQDAPVIWPRDMNAKPDATPAWGNDPEALRDA